MELFRPGRPGRLACLLLFLSCAARAQMVPVRLGEAPRAAQVDGKIAPLPASIISVPETARGEISALDFPGRLPDPDDIPSAAVRWEGPRFQETAQVSDDGRRFDGLFDGSESARVLMLRGNGDARRARGDLARSEADTLDQSSFLFQSDEAGLANLALLRSAARSGKRTRLLIDAVGNRVAPEFLDHLRREGVQTRLYHPLRWDRLSWIWRRMHDKLLISGGREMLVGDRNVGIHYLGLAKNSYVNRELYLEGPAVGRAQAYFDSLWASDQVAEPRRKVSAGQARSAGERLDEAQAGLERLGAHDVDPGVWSRTARPVRRALFTHDDIRFKAGKPGTGSTLSGLIRSARRSLILENPYVVLPESLRADLRNAAARGVRVVLITNSRQTTNQPAAFDAYDAELPALAALGVEVWEYQGTGTLHLKVALADSRVAFVNSYNLDPRSALFNLEVGALIDDEAVAAHLFSQLESDWSRSRLVAADGRLLRRVAWGARARAFLQGVFRTQL